MGSFLIALGVFTAVWSVITAIFYTNALYTESLGYLSLFIEATLGMPQLIRNFQRKSTTGMSIPMVLTWLLGDIGKLAYFVLKQNPMQFVMCACLQISVDCFILGQVIVYRKNRGTSLPYENNSPPQSIVD
ncbi:unnamed protein product, partial [Mesorhabditis spiculigera]